MLGFRQAYYYVNDHTIIKKGFFDLIMESKLCVSSLILIKRLLTKYHFCTKLTKISPIHNNHNLKSIRKRCQLLLRIYIFIFSCEALIIVQSILKMCDVIILHERLQPLQFCYCQSSSLFLVLAPTLDH